ncbi:branched-chain amino acid ABC transporter permease [Rhodoligotrophos appendicifer]|uniref:branched-chain amino acid ABC transporter permease n=2 Tax=Rhodoligotrophos appendicifer TaxID=987056 RepID=UPI003D216F44
MFALTVAILIVAPFLFYPVLVMKALCYALFASAFAFLLAYSGLLSFGHAAYFGIASYMTAYGAKHLGFSPELAIVAGVLVAIVLGAVLGAIAIRRQGIYFSMITLALAQMVYFICLQAEGITGGEDGIQAVPRGTLFGIFSLNDDMSLYVVVAIVFLAAMLFLYRVMNSPFGHVARAIRGNEARAISLGYKANRHKLLVFIISAGLAGLAGSMKAIVFQLASLNDVHWSMSGDAVLMTLVGGVGTLSGPVIGGIFVVWMQYFLAGIGSWLLIVKGAIFILCVLLFRSGLIGTLAKRLRLPL